MDETETGNSGYWKSRMKVSMQIGTGLIISGIMILLAATAILRIQVYNNVILSVNSKAFQMWKNPPASVYRKYYFFDVQNPEEILAGEKPYVVERGPYAYKEVFEKKNVKFLDDYVVSYSPVTTIFFEPSLSIGNESDVITFLNIPALAIIETVTKSEYVKYSVPLVNGLFKLFNTKFFIKKKVSEILSGYKDPLLEMASKFVPDIVKDGTFSIINGQNGTVWQSYTMETGYRKPIDVAKILTWNDKQKLDIWNSSSANSFKGTDGTYFAPFLQRHKTIYAFNPNMCRTYSLTYLKDSEVAGVKTYAFHLPENIFWNSTLNPENIGFCDNDCLGNGVQNISKCYGGISSFISQPHFLNAEDKFIEAVTGLKPNHDKHDFVLDFEPVSGVPLNGSIRFQINFFYRNDSRIPLVHNVVPTLLPVIWFESSIEIDRKSLDELGKLSVVADVFFLIPFVIFLVGIAAVIISLILLVKIATKEDRLNESLNSQNETNDGFSSATSTDSQGLED